MTTHTGGNVLIMSHAGISLWWCYKIRQYLGDSLQDRHDHCYCYASISGFHARRCASKFEYVCVCMYVRNCYMVVYLWSPIVMGRPLYFTPVVSVFLLSSFFPRLISAVGDWMSTVLPHMMWH